MDGDDEEQRKREQLSLGGRPPSRLGDRLDRLTAAVRRRLGSWFGPVVTAVVAVLCLAGLATVVFAGDDGAPDASRPAVPSETTSTQQPAAPQKPVTTIETLPVIPEGAPPALPFYAASRLAWPDGQSRLPRRNLAYLVARDGVSLALEWQPQRVVLFDGPRLRPLDHGVVSGPAIGPGAEVAAWTVARGPGRFGSLVLWDLAEDRRRAMLPIRLGFACCDHPGIQVVGIDGNGLVYVTAAGRYLVWDPDAGTLDELAGTRRFPTLSAVRPDGPVFIATPRLGARAHAVYGTVEGGRFVAAGTVHSEGGAWSSDGDVIAHLVSRTSAVAHPLDGLAVTLRTPRDWPIVDLAWESDTAVMVVIARPGSNAAWLRCDAGSGQCEIAADLGDPMRFGQPWAVADNTPRRSL